MVQPSLISAARTRFHSELLDSVLTTDRSGIPSNADRDNRFSVAIARGIVERLGASASAERLPGHRSGSRFERACEQFVNDIFLSLGHLRPGNWTVARINVRDKIGIARFEQYQHLSELESLANSNSVLASAIGSDYIISPDIVISREPEPDEIINNQRQVVDSSYALLANLRRRNNSLPILHASISCKWTIRSDRAQNARSEALNLIRNRKGRLLHIVVVTSEPLPSRIASLALGTGDIDCVYHFALPELQNTVQELDYGDSQEMMEIMISGRRLRDISDLPLDLAA